METDLAPETAAFLAALAQGPGLSFREMTVEQVRQAVRGMGGIFDAPPDLGVLAEDVEVALDRREIPVRMYSPPVCRDEGPVILFMHGGGWVACDIESHDSFCRFLARYSQLRVVSVGYRLAPETPFPGAIDDVMGVARWLSDGRSPFGAVNGMILSGDSAGGGLAAGLAYQDDAARLDIKALLLFYPALDLTHRAPSHREFAKGFMLEAADVSYFVDHYVPDIERRSDKGCSPLAAFDPARTPPVAILTCSHDVLRDEGRAFVAACRAGGVPSKHVEASGYIHGIITFRKAMPSGVDYIKNTIDGVLSLID
ncbi:alpha/beta hydrolase [Sphingobium estronivorans]|uniref:alpha/beta hydrolase n=1 Tax=Sphingobium estronivorans TaxID=1577690 RepID=UPI0013C35CE7|nr:alpha/beta hydrolase [Sphingobium estronivorans]